MRTPIAKTTKRPLRRILGPEGQRLVPPPEPEPPDPLDGAPVVGGLVLRDCSPRPQVASARGPPITRRRTQVTKVTDEEAGPRGPAPSSGHRMKYDPKSPGLGQQDPVLGDLAAQSKAQRAFLKQALREQAERAEARAHAAYEQSCAALGLISKSMENVRTALTEANRARDRYYDLLTVSSRARRRYANASDSPARTAYHPYRPQSKILAPEQRREAQPALVSTALCTLSAARCELNTRRARVRDWVENHRSLLPRRPPGEEPDAPPPVTRAKHLRNTAKPMGGLPAGPQRRARVPVGCTDQYNAPWTCEPVDGAPPPHVPRAQALITVPWDPGGHSGSPGFRHYSPSSIPAANAAALLQVQQILQESFPSDPLPAAGGPPVVVSAGLFPLTSLPRAPPLTHQA